VSGEATYPETEEESSNNQSEEAVGLFSANVDASEESSMLREPNEELDI
jgi:hypothetical protein